MDHVTARLEKCFATVFPELPPDSIRRASAQTVERWDSFAQITLLSLVGEEFGIALEFGEFAEAFSFSEILDLLRPRLNGA